MTARCSLFRQHGFRWLACGALAVSMLGSCGDTGNNPLLPSAQGGPGTVVPLDKDGGSDARLNGTGGKSTGTATGLGGTATATTGAGGNSGTTGMGGSPGSGGAGGKLATGGAGGGMGGAAGAGGAVVQDDPCTACEKASCGHPAGLTSSKTSAYAGLVGAYEVCFLGTGWPSDQADPAHFCGGVTGATSAVAQNGPDQNEPKTTLCQDLLKCIHQ